MAAAAVDVAAGEGVDVWRLPGWPNTKSDEHHWAPGTVWLDFQTMMSTVVQIGRSVAATPARRLAFLNGLGGMSALLQIAGREIRRLYGLRTFVLHAAVPPDQGGPSAAGELGLGVHGALQETAMILHLHPEMVDMALAVRSVPEHLTQYEHVGVGKSVSFCWLSDDFGTSGVIGDPTGATDELGAELFATAVQRCAAALAEVAVFDPALRRT